MYEVRIGARPIESLAKVLPVERVQYLERRAEALRPRLGARVVWNVNSTAAGGGVAEMLRSYLRYARGAGINAQWLVIEAPPAFFRVAKRLHNALHGSRGDGSPIGPEQAAVYESGLAANVLALDTLVREGDIVICHDPQTAGLLPHLVKLGARVAWRCHVGTEEQTEEVERGWAFLRPYLETAPLAIFTRATYAPRWLRGKRELVLRPNIDPLSAKNQIMDDASVRAILAFVGIVDGPQGPGAPVYTRDDGSAGRVSRMVEMLCVGPSPSWETPLVVQVSRWDAMKDHRGVLEAFARSVEPEVPRGAHLVLAGPQLGSVADDPEDPRVFGELESAWRSLPEVLRRAVHLVSLPMADAEENAAIVNALQRHAAVVVQKSLREGFGLTVTEAMWKARPVVASAIGGIPDQIRDGIDGLLVRSPTDLSEFARLLRLVLGDEALARRLGHSAHERVRDDFLVDIGLEHWANVLDALVG
ncbi:MAG TPA: glycosyltransferase [Polyangiaceae bacterium]